MECYGRVTEWHAKDAVATAGKCSINHILKENIGVPSSDAFSPMPFPTPITSSISKYFFLVERYVMF